jgi:hypothetical protein
MSWHWYKCSHKLCLNWHRGYKWLWAEQKFRSFIILTTVFSRWKNQWYIVSVTFGAKYLTGMVTSVPPYETVSLIKNKILHQSKSYKNKFENSNFWGMWPLGHVGHVTYSFINMLFIWTGIFVHHSINNNTLSDLTINSDHKFCR